MVFTVPTAPEINDWSHGFLSSSTMGSALLITATSSGAPDTVHTATTDVTKIDFVTVDVVNVTTARAAVYIRLASTNAADFFPLSIPAQARVTVLDSVPISDTKLVEMYSAVSGEFRVFGRYKRVTVA